MSKAPLSRFIAVLLFGALTSPEASIADWVVAASFDLGAGRGVSAVDFDSDGDADVAFAVAFGGGLRLVRNDGGSFVEVTPTSFASGNVFASAWADLDRDHDLDVYVVRASGGNRLFRNDGGSFHDATNGLPLAIGGTNVSASFDDVENDGDLDLLVCRTGLTTLLRNDGALNFADVTSAAIPALSNVRQGSFADVDRDGDRDLLLVAASGSKTLLRNDGNVHWEDAMPLSLQTPTSGQGATWADFDGDEDLDVYVTNELLPNEMFRNDGDFAFALVPLAALADSSNSKSSLAFDHDLDGDLDLFWVNDGTVDRLVRNDGNFAFVENADPVIGDPGPGVGSANADFDDDGDVDLALAQSFAPCRILRNDGPITSTYLQVDLQGGLSNVDGVGAFLVVSAGGLRTVREVTAGSGSLSQSVSTQNFGLGGQTSIDSLRVHWPSGLAQIVGPLTANQKMTVVEPGANDVREVLKSGGPGARFAVFPNPGAGVVHIRAIAGEPFDVTAVEVFDVQGRRVGRVTGPRRLSPGEILSWDPPRGPHFAGGKPLFLRVGGPDWEESSQFLLF